MTSGHGPGPHGHSGREAHHAHHHTGLARAGERHRGRLLAAFVVVGVFFVVEAVAGVLTNSLALVSDAAHMLTDVVGMGMALVAIQAATRFARRDRHDASPHTFGLYRLEILAALANAVLLMGIAAWVVLEAIRRLNDEPEVLGIPMLLVAAGGLAVNLVAFWLLRPGSRESLNIEGAYLEVVADTVGSVGVIVAALAVEVAGWWWADPLVGAAIGIWILPRTWRLGRQAVRVLLQSAPERIDLGELRRRLGELPGVLDVHDLHVWTLTSEMDAASAHLVVADGADPHPVLDAARHLLASHYEVEHATFQVEPASHEGCQAVTW